MAEQFLTIVSGLPRSGTSMMMRMLDEGGLPALTDNLRKADEDNPMGYYEFEPVKKTKQDPSWLKQADGKVVKMVYRLLYDLPPTNKYRVVFMRRRLEEVVASQNVMLERRGKAGGDMSDEQVLKTFQAELDKFFGWVRSQPNFKLLEINYNDVLGEPKPQIAAINRFLDNRLNEQKMFTVVDPALYRQRKD